MAKRLRWGFSTGTAASAASKAALIRLLKGTAPGRVQVRLPGGKTLRVTVQDVRPKGPGVVATVIKDGGDDPDVTHGAEIEAFLLPIKAKGPRHLIEIHGGRGVGQVTKRGLSVPPGMAAINPVPMRMIKRACLDVLGEAGDEKGFSMGIKIEVRVPRGEELAKQTLNPRLGILGGISILGTTGLVKPFSHGAYRATIYTALKVARSSGLKDVFLVTGSTSDAYARTINPGFTEEAFVQMGDYVKFSVEWAERFGFERIFCYAFLGKALKMAQGLSQTHASKGEVDLEFLGRLTQDECKDQGVIDCIKTANTAREALEILKGAGLLKVVGKVGALAETNLKGFLRKGVFLNLTILDYGGEVLWKRGA